MEAPSTATLRFCVTANLDLLGFSRHLEVGNNDLRTKIGIEALKRLSRLDRVVDLFINESKRCKAEYGGPFMTALRYVRVNDAIIATLDLSEVPAVTSSEFDEATIPATQSTIQPPTD